MVAEDVRGGSAYYKGNNQVICDVIAGAWGKKF